MLSWRKADAKAAASSTVRVAAATPLRFGRTAVARGRFLRFGRTAVARARLLTGVQPLVDRWGQRGKPVHRYYVEEFLSQHRTEIRGRVLEFQDNVYATRFGEGRIDSVDILHKDPDRPGTTIVADLTADSAIPSGSFDCIICTYVLHAIYAKERAVAELHRILKPHGTLLVAVPNITVDFSPEWGELWRFTATGLHRVLGQHFGDDHVAVEAYGNSLTAAGELRGLSVTDFRRSELAHRDSRFSLVICARAVKHCA
jgi:SAM-dependent methyltransferase